MPFSACIMIIAPDSAAFCIARRIWPSSQYKHPGVGHEQLEAGDPLVVDQVGHRLQRLLVDAADDLVEAVVDRAVPGGLLVPLGEPFVHAGVGVLHGEVDDRGDPAPGRGDRAGLEVVGRDGAAERQLHVGVGVDPARDDVLAGGVDRTVGGDAERRGLAGREDRGDRLAVDQHVAVDDRPSAETIVPF